MQEMQVQPLGQEDPLEKDMATLYSFFFFFFSNPVFLPGKISWTEEAGRLQSMESQKNETQLSN